MTLLEATVAILIMPVSAFLIAFWVLHKSRRITIEAHRQQKQPN